MSSASAAFAEARALHRSLQLAPARTLYLETLRIEPDHVGALQLLGVLSAQAGDPKAAVELLDRALAIDPANAGALCNRALVLCELGDDEGALGSYDRALSHRPDFAEALSNRAVLLRRFDRLDEALVSCERALRVKPDFAEAHSNRADVLCDLGRTAEALVSYDRAIGLQPDLAQAYSGKGDLFANLGQLGDALHCCDRAIALQPDFAEAHSNRGNVLRRLGRLDEALSSCDAALALKPRLADAHCNRGAVLATRAEFDAALASFAEAIALRPRFALAHSNRGSVLQKLGQLDAALASYDRAVEIEPELAIARFNRGTARLLNGDFSNGFADYEYRWVSEHGMPVQEVTGHAGPQWTGTESLAGRTILLHAEQGLGDTLQFCRYAEPVARLAHRVILQVPKPLVDVLSGLSGVSKLVARGEPVPPYDYQCPLLSLPLALRTTEATIPSPGGYLQPDSAGIEAWRRRLGPRSRRRVGLVWSGNPGNANDDARGVPLEELIRSLPTDHDYYCLQKDIRDGDRRVLDAHREIFHDPDNLDFPATAALCACMDVVISVDTSIAHLSAALHCRTWVLLPYVPDWRWLLWREDSPWYASARLYRQSRRGDWQTPLARIAADLRMASDGPG